MTNNPIPVNADLLTRCLHSLGAACHHCFPSRHCTLTVRGAAPMPAGTRVGCSKCRTAAKGCAECRGKVGVVLRRAEDGHPVV